MFFLGLPVCHQTILTCHQSSKISTVEQLQYEPLFLAIQKLMFKDTVGHELQ